MKAEGNCNKGRDAFTYVAQHRDSLCVASIIFVEKLSQSLDLRLFFKHRFVPEHDKDKPPVRIMLIVHGGRAELQASCCRCNRTKGCPAIQEEFQSSHRIHCLASIKHQVYLMCSGSEKRPYILLGHKTVIWRPRAMRKEEKELVKEAETPDTIPNAVVKLAPAL